VKVPFATLAGDNHKRLLAVNKSGKAIADTMLIALLLYLFIPLLL